MHALGFPVRHPSFPSLSFPVRQEITEKKNGPCWTGTKCDSVPEDADASGQSRPWICPGSISYPMPTPSRTCAEPRALFTKVMEAKECSLCSPAPCQVRSIHAISAVMPYGQGHLLFRRGSLGTVGTWLPYLPSSGPAAKIMSCR